MMTPNKTKLVTLMLLASTATASAQVYAGTGYAALQPAFQNWNSIIKNFNDSYGNALPQSQRMPDFKVLQGISFELGYAAAPLNVGVSWHNLTANKQNTISSATGAESVVNTIRYANDMLSIYGDFALLRGIGVGMAMDYNVIQVNRVKSNEASIRLPLLDAHQWSNRFYGHLDLWLSSRMSVSVCPYVRRTWSAVDYRPLIQALQLTDNSQLVEDKKWNWGIQLSVRSYIWSRSRD
jgi:hypothetical protein